MLSSEKELFELDAISRSLPKEPPLSKAGIKNLHPNLSEEALEILAGFYDGSLDLLSIDIMTKEILEGRAKWLPKYPPIANNPEGDTSVREMCEDLT